jgi:hypothetical protein
VVANDKSSKIKHKDRSRRSKSKGLRLTIASPHIHIPPIETLKFQDVDLRSEIRRCHRAAGISFSVKIPAYALRPRFTWETGRAA